ncbi:bifunctional diguanylate cyclase/phosphodiesterase [Azoarcus sp. KH32C]|uniref:sensor domain-containing protein n=1 Tax=Azoarcus sp. KH32C TaxID=748247 RepID=UPI0002386840|nr:bifunctional diguanylate cyclase/phosphodiesterase [Azoarcus sp. KH32C]BAL24760.1 diguanylate cyclase/phosphodiesterase with PAS/PAC sensor [Azoarcus sp. KH32C]
MISLDALAPLLDGLLESVLVVDGSDLRIVCANGSACALLGVPHSGLIGRPIREIAATPEDMFFWEEVRHGLSHEIHSETILRRDDGTILNIDRRVTRVAVEDARAVYLVGINDCSEQRRVEDELERIVAELRATIESTADGILVVDLARGIRSYNHRFAELWDIPRDLMTRRDDEATYAWLEQSVIDPEQYARRLDQLTDHPLLEDTEVIVLHSGKVLERVSLPQYARGRPVGRVFSFRDITQSLADKSRLQLAAKVFSASLDAILIIDSEQRVVAANAKSLESSGCDEGELIGQRTDSLLFKPEDDNFVPEILRRVESDGFWEGELTYRRKDGLSIPGLASFVRALDDEGKPPQYVLFFKDLTDKLAAKKRIEELAYSDTLTGLPNRVQLNERIEFALNWSAREQRHFAVLFIDLDRFKQINDSLGHIFGDRVLVEVAKRIKECIRQCDTAARLGGDEFLLLLQDVDQRGAETTARRILAALTRSFVLDDMTLTVTCSIGVALYPGDGLSADDLIKNADTAMYNAKERGRAGFRFYQRQMNLNLLARMKLDQALREAFEHQRFRLKYQPQINLATGSVIGVEALLRWTDPEMGEVPPGRFIPQAEENGLIIRLGDWVLNQAVNQAVAWQKKDIDLIVAVNVSALQFQNPDFIRSVSTVLRRSGLPPRQLELELTESILIQDADEALLRLQALAELGVRLSIDDFGTGYSSLTYLKRFPIHKLKIDRSFVQGLPNDESDTAITTAIISIGRTLKLGVIAEGVETESQREFLAVSGCDQFQGFLCSPAVAPEEIEVLASELGTHRRPGKLARMVAMHPEQAID